MKATVLWTTALACALGACSTAEVRAQQRAAAAVPTQLIVRVVSHDAKVIGTAVGGARVTVREVESGRVLASGVQSGGTGSTPLIVQEPRERYQEVYGGAATFAATLELDRPTRIEVIAEGPLGAAQAVQRASKTILMIPGRHIEGDGLVLELHGFTVEIQNGAAEDEVAEVGQPYPVQARVTMLCGCPTEPGGVWDADRFEITARLLREGNVIVESTLSYAGTTSTYRGAIVPPEPGSYQLEVLAVDRSALNAGIVSVPFTASP